MTATILDILAAIFGVIIAPLCVIGVLTPKTRVGQAARIGAGISIVIFFLAVWGNTGRDPLQWAYCYAVRTAPSCRDIKWDTASASLTTPTKPKNSKSQNVSEKVAILPTAVKSETADKASEKVKEVLPINIMNQTKINRQENPPFIPPVLPKDDMQVTNTPKSLTVFNSKNGRAKLLRIWGMSLQWVDMSPTPAQYGKARAVERNGYIHVSGEHKSNAKDASATVDGDVIYIDDNKMILRGLITIVNAPSDEPNCTKRGDFTFVESGFGRKYWRIDGEICPERGVKDYLDIYY